MRQPKPRRNDSRPIIDMVVEDLHRRADAGEVKYETRLQAFNGLDPLVDLYEELQDATLYVRQEIEERREAAVQSGARYRPSQILRCPLCHDPRPPAYIGQDVHVCECCGSKFSVVPSDVRVRFAPQVLSPK